MSLAGADHLVSEVVSRQHIVYARASQNRMPEAVAPAFLQHASLARDCSSPAALGKTRERSGC